MVNNQYNQYNNDSYNNQYNNQYNNYSGYNGNNGMPNQMPPMQNQNYNQNDNRGGGVFSFLVAVILLICAVAFLLHLLGIIDLEDMYHKYIKRDADVTENNNDKKDDEQKDNNVISEVYKDELTAMCSLIDTDGNYRNETRNDFCTDKVCMLNIENKIYAKNCVTNEYRVSTIEEFQEKLQKETVLDTLCSNIDANGYHVAEKNEESGLEYSCSNFVCKVKINNNEYQKTCKTN